MGRRGLKNKFFGVFLVVYKKKGGKGLCWGVNTKKANTQQNTNQTKKNRKQLQKKREKAEHANSPFKYHENGACTQKEKEKRKKIGPRGTGTRLEKKLPGFSIHEIRRNVNVAGYWRIKA